MPPISLIPFIAAALAVALAIASGVRTPPSIPSVTFAVGMLLVGLDSVCTGMALRAESVADGLGWIGIGLFAKAWLPAAWLAFTSTYARSGQAAILRRNLPVVLVAAAVPVSLLLLAPESLLAIVPLDQTRGAVLLASGTTARIFHASLLVGFVLALTHLEQTFVASVGTMRWRVKYVAVGLGVLLGASIFVNSQAILYQAHDPFLGGIESSALLVGAVFLTIAYWRDGLGEFDVHPSRAVVRSSLTVLIVGGYLFVVGVLSQVVREFGGAGSFQVQALVVLLGGAGLAILLLSNRLRRTLHAFVGRHFAKAQHDSTHLWTELSRQVSSSRDERQLCTRAATLLTNTFDVLGVSVWLGDDECGCLRLTAAPATSATTDAATARDVWPAMVAALELQPAPFDIEDIQAPWAEELRRLSPSTFASGGRRWCVPLRSSERLRGAIVLSDRVGGAPWSDEERALLQCVAEHVAATLENLRLGDEVARARELEAFRTMSAFFVHDLKNAANSLNLMLKNLPVHFDDPAFRTDALRAVGNTVTRIDGMIARLGALRQQPGLRPTPVAIAPLVEDAATELQGADVVLHCAVPGDLPIIQGDREQLRSVVANLLLNARDAIHARGSSDQGGRIDVRGIVDSRTVVLEIEDNGCGMSPDFLREGLFRPFQSTKSKGLGIGMFQARQVIEQHGGSIHVESRQGTGTTVRVSLPVASEVQHA